MRLSTLLIGSLGLLAACSCNDQQFQPLEYTELTDDYGKWLSMDRAPDGSPIIAYYDVTFSALGFATGDLKSDGTVRWIHERVDGWPDSGGLDSGDAGQYTSMAVAPDGTIWVSYYAASALRVAHRVHGEWTNEIVDAGSGLSPDVGQWTSLAIDSAGQPVVAYYDVANHELKVAHRLDGAWQAEVAYTGSDFNGTDAEGNPVVRTADVGQYARIEIVGDNEYIAFYDAAQQDLQMVEGFRGAYAHTVIAHTDGIDQGQWPAIWVDGESMSVAFENRTDGNLMLASRTGARDFTVETVDDAEYSGSDAEVFQLDGAMAILFFDGRYNDMMLARQENDGWSVEKLGGDDGAVGFFNEVQTFGDRTVAASYDYTHKTLYWRPL